MIQIVWEFIVKEATVDRFLRAYGPDGAWSRLFQEYPGFLGTTLLRDEENPRRFLTIDIWETGSQHKRMLTHAKAQYSDLDEALADLTESEDEIGIFETLPNVSVRASQREPRQGTRDPKSEPPNKEMKPTSVERTGGSQLSPRCSPDTEAAE
jgi:heme-degrading monooxygenase HmoA